MHRSGDTANNGATTCSVVVLAHVGNEDLTHHHDSYQREHNMRPHPAQSGNWLLKERATANSL